MVRLFINYYKDKDPKRDEEIEECFWRNQQIFDEIYVFDECSKDIGGSVVGRIRPSYRTLFEAANSKINSPDDISIIANSDIAFPDASLRLIETHLKPNMCFALTRWDTPTSVPPVNQMSGRIDEWQIRMNACSQDAWCFRGPIKIPAYCDFYLGKPGCDNRIAWELLRVGYRVLNPCKSIKTYHHHMSQVRNHNQSERIMEPYYFVPLISVEDIK